MYYVDTLDVDGPSSDLIGLTSYSDPENRTVLYALYDSNEKMIANDRVPNFYFLFLTFRIPEKIYTHGV